MATKTIKRTKKQHERIVNNDPKTFDDFPVGTVSHQGDLILVRIAELPKSAKARLNRKLADGDTQGSRHILDAHGEVFNCEPSEVVAAIAAARKGLKIDARYIGPVFTTPATLTHPEHGWQSWTEDGVIACVIQRNIDSEQREARVMD